MTQLTLLVGILLSVGCFAQRSNRFVQEYANETHRVEAGSTAGRVTILKIRGDQNAVNKFTPHFKHLQKLRVLHLAHVTVSAANLDSFAELPIERLALANCGVDDRAWQKIASMQQLSFLDVYEKGISDADFLHLGQLPKLEELRASGTQITGRCFKEGFSVLRKLWLTSCPVDDEGLKSIANLRCLEFLDISDSVASADGVMHLASVHSLQTVWGPKELSVEDGIAAWHAHVLSKREARIKGIDVPPDEKSPFAGYERIARRELITARNKRRRCPWPQSVETGKREMSILRLLGRDKGVSVLQQVDRIHADADPTIDYTSTDRSLVDIFEKDFGVNFETTPIGVLPPERWHESPNILDMKKFSQAIKGYLSGHEPGVPLKENSE